MKFWGTWVAPLVERPTSALRSWSRGLWGQVPCWALCWQAGACLDSLSPSLSACPPLVLCLSKRNKLQKIKKKLNSLPTCVCTYAGITVRNCWMTDCHLFRVIQLGRYLHCYIICQKKAAVRKIPGLRGGKGLHAFCLPSPSSSFKIPPYWFEITD